jgi:hypothetical protein
MKKLLFITLFLAGIGASSLAQGKRDTIRYQFSHVQKKKLKNELGLSKPQARALKASNQEFKVKMMALKNDTTLDRQKKKKQLRELSRERQQKMDSLLSPEQRKKAMELRKEKLAQQKEGKE